MDEKESLLGLFRFWLFGTFTIVFTAITMYIGLFADRDPWLAIRAGFPIWGTTGALCILWYLVYRWYLNRKY